MQMPLVHFTETDNMSGVVVLCCPLRTPGHLWASPRGPKGIRAMEPLLVGGPDRGLFTCLVLENPKCSAHRYDVTHCGPAV